MSKSKTVRLSNVVRLFPEPGMDRHPLAVKPEREKRRLIHKLVEDVLSDLDPNQIEGVGVVLSLRQDGAAYGMFFDNRTAANALQGALQNLSRFVQES